MAKDSAPSIVSPALVASPANIDAHQADMQRRQAERDAKRPTLLDCLDPTEAKRAEDRKPLYEWKVEAKLFRPATPKQQAHLETFDKNVVAQNENDAWAVFCDSISEWPSRKDCKPKFTRLKKRTLRGTEDDE
jgi:hypothetical protein